jgi:hypothetical protein
MKTSGSRKAQTVSERFTDQIYALDFSVKDENGNTIEIPESGFLGLLASGYKGLIMIRKKRGTTHLYSKFTKGKKITQKKRRPKTP